MYGWNPWQLYETADLGIEDDQSVEYGVRHCQEMSIILQRLINDGNVGFISYRWQRRVRILCFCWPYLFRKCLNIFSSILASTVEHKIVAGVDVEDAYNWSYLEEFTCNSSRTSCCPTITVCPATNNWFIDFARCSFSPAAPVTCTIYLLRVGYVREISETWHIAEIYRRVAIFLPFILCVYFHLILLSELR